MNDTQKKDVQISKYQTGKKLIELVSRLKPGYPAQNTWQQHHKKKLHAHSLL